MGELADWVRSLLGKVRDWLSELVPSWFPPGLPGFWTALLLGSVVAVVIALAVAPKVQLARWRVALWLGSLLLVPAATWTIPHHAGALSTSLRWCTQGQIPRPSMLTQGASQEVVSNLLLTVPAGAAVVLWPIGAPRLAALCVALAVSPTIEAVQLVPELQRGCQFGDVVNNSIGVLIGFALAAGLAAILSSWHASVDESRGPPDR